MTALSATAPGKIILFGEHAVVYGQPAIAVPVSIVQARAVISAIPAAPNGQVRLIAPDIHLDSLIDELPDDHPLVLAILLTAGHLGAQRLPAMQVHLSSSIPLAGGFGSSAATAIAIIRAVSAFLGRPLSNDIVSELAYRVERRQHGNPSGIDNTVVAFEQPVYFVRGQPFETLIAARPFTLVIGDSGVQSSTAAVVADVQRLHQADPESIDRAFTAIGDIVRQARGYIQAGMIDNLGELMNHNQRLLKELTISSPELDLLVEAALANGAMGAKLSGGGRGGNMIALVSPQTASRVERALIAAGAVHTWITTVAPILGPTEGLGNANNPSSGFPEIRRFIDYG
ncbi:mevalonate kinase [Longilinea arvoryzae]|nr:mevalonate kinase [Longilinea arvoryzae]